MTVRVDYVNDGEPLIVLTDDGSHECEHKPGCTSRSRWYVEATTSAERGEPYLGPVRYVCNRHVVAAFNELLEVRESTRVGAR